MDELTAEELAIAAKMNVSPEDYAANKPPAELSADALAFGASEVAAALGISEEDWQKYGAVVFEEDTEDGI